MLTVDANVWVAAFDARDRFHEASSAFFRSVAREGLRMNGPEFLALEVSCALARRARDARIGMASYERLRAHPALSLVPVGSDSIEAAQAIGSRYFLRGADALYAAAASRTGSPLITWDEELLSRFAGITPSEWLARS